MFVSFVLYFPRLPALRAFCSRNCGQVLALPHRGRAVSQAAIEACRHLLARQRVRSEGYASRRRHFFYFAKLRFKVSLDGCIVFSMFLFPSKAFRRVKVRTRSGRLECKPLLRHLLPLQLSVHSSSVSLSSLKLASRIRKIDCLNSAISAIERGRFISAVSFHIFEESEPTLCACIKTNR